MKKLTIGSAVGDVISHFNTEIKEEIPFESSIAEVSSLDIKQFSVNSFHERKSPKITMP